MKRDVIIILGRTGSGKSQWAKIYTHRKAPLYIFDPLMSYQNVEHDDDGGIIRDTLDDPRPDDRILIARPELVPLASDTAFTRGNCTLLVEECAIIWPKGSRIDESMTRQIFLGRHRAVNLIFIAQRAVSIPIDIRSQANRVICFGQLETDDLNWLGEFYGREKARTIPQLRPFECFDYHDGDVKKYSIEARAKKHNYFPVELDL